MLEKIVNHYAPEAGIKEHVQLGDINTIEEPDAKTAFAFWKQSTKTYNFFVDAINGNINRYADNYNNIIISLVHEKMHKDDYENTKEFLN